MLAEFSPLEVLSIAKDSWKSANMRSRAALYCASRSSLVIFDLSLLSVPPVGDIRSSSLFVSTPVSDVAFEGIDELGAVLPPADL